MKSILSRDDRERYQRDLGWEPDGKGSYKQHRFKLGRDYSQALIRSIKLAQLWEAVQKWCMDTRVTPRAVWDDFTLGLALALARGEEAVEVQPNQPEATPTYLMMWLAHVQGCFPMIRLCLPGQLEQQRQAGIANLEQMRALHSQIGVALAEQTARMTGKPGGPTFHEALDAFSEWAGRHYRDVGEDRPSAFGVTFQKRVDLVKRHVGDMPLASFGLIEIEALLDYWRKRPKTKRDKPAARETVKNQIKCLRLFIKWLHKSREFDWKKPEDYEVEPVRILTTPEETARKYSTTTNTVYSVEQLGTLYEYASPTERLYLLLALNCGFQADQIATLQVEQFSVGPHGYYSLNGAWIKKVRLKSQVYGEWKLWPVTIAGLEWVRQGRTEGYMVVGKHGRPLTTRTKGGNRNQAIPNAWQRAIDRIKKDKPDFPDLPFGALKDTAVSEVRRLVGGEVASVFVCHGQPTDDPLLEVYANRPFDQVFLGCDKWGEVLAPVFAKVADPFPAGRRKKNPSLSLEKRRKIKEMREQKVPYKIICKTLDVSMDTVRRYSKV